MQGNFKNFIKFVWCKSIAVFFRLETKWRFKGIAYLFLKWEAARNYRYFVHENIDWNNPIDLNQKINWLKFHSNSQTWGDLADKYKVREFIKDMGMQDILIPLYGVWNKAKEIDFNKLPSSFVLKTNHGSGEVVIVCDKNHLDINKVIKQLNACLEMPYGVESGEPHYLLIKPKIIAEQYLLSKDKFSTSLVDYKIWCFNGEPQHIWVCYSRTKKEVRVESYDLEWNYHPEYSVFTDHYINGGGIVPKPVNLGEMLDVARKLSHGFKQVRVDLYNQNGKIYFGEMTFTSNGGYMNFYTREFLNEMGNKISIY